MSAIIQVLMAAAIIAGLIGLRLFADNRAARSRARGAVDGHADCHRRDCLRTCDADRPTSRTDRGTDKA